MRILSSILIISYLVTGCRKDVDLKAIFLKNQESFKKIENPVRTDKKYIFEKSTIRTNGNLFNSTYLINIEKVFLKTDFDIEYIVDGDMLLGCKKNLSKLFFTNKKVGDYIDLLNFKGRLSYLLQNGKSKKSPFVIPIAPNWYIVRDLGSL